MKAENIKRLQVAVSAATLGFIFSGLIFTLIEVIGFFPWLNGYSSVLVVATLFSSITAVLGYILPRLISLMICFLTFGTVDIEC